jgi:hypothetical protein
MPAAILQLPAWLGTALIGALVASVAYVAKLVMESLSKWMTARRERRERLVTLQSLLLASGVTHLILRKLVRRLCDEIRRERPDIDGPFDQILAAGFAFLNERQKLEHGLIRSYTTECIRPLDVEMIKWLTADTYFKGESRSESLGALAQALQKLEAHLVLWRAKYEFWIPDKPERAIVSMSDEERHGVEFPKGIEKLVAKITGSTMELHWNLGQAAAQSREFS